MPFTVIGEDSNLLVTLCLHFVTLLNKLPRILRLHVLGDLYSLVLYTLFNALGGYKEQLQGLIVFSSSKI